VPQPTIPHLIVAARVVVPIGVLDLTKSEVTDALGTNAMELTGNWLLDDDPPTQALGEIAHELGVVALRYHSARPRDGDGRPNLVVFRDLVSVTRGCCLELHDPAGDIDPPVPTLSGPI
jgi:hypothetical protein